MYLICKNGDYGYDNNALPSNDCEYYSELNGVNLINAAPVTFVKMKKPIPLKCLENLEMILSENKIYEYG